MRKGGEREREGGREGRREGSLVHVQGIKMHGNQLTHVCYLLASRARITRGIPL